MFYAFLEHTKKYRQHATDFWIEQASARNEFVPEEGVLFSGENVVSIKDDTVAWASAVHQCEPVGNQS